MILRLTAWLLAALLCAAALPRPVSAQRDSRRAALKPMRDWRTWPFSRRSPWNHPIGSGAQYTPVARLANYPIGINYEDRWTAAIAVAEASDPLATMLFSPNWGRTSSWAFLDRGNRNCGNGTAAEQYLRRYSAATWPPTPGNYYSTTSTPNDHHWSLPASYHAAGDDWRGTFHLPAGSCPSPDSDGLLAVFQPDGWVIDIYAGVVLSSGEVVGTMASWIDVRGDGTGWWNGRRASMLPSFAGLIRDGEIAAGRIPHALAAQLPRQLLKEEAVWPAYAFDRDSSYTGTVPMGALLAIPATVDLDGLGLSTDGRVIARAAQDYGVYVVDRGGSGITILAELGAPDIRWEARDSEPAWWKDLEIIRDQLRRVTNNGPSSRGGGGTPRVPLPAHLRRD
jgi:hypothetical protein